MDTRHAFLLKKIGLYRLEVLTVHDGKIDTGEHKHLLVGTQAEAEPWAKKFEDEIRAEHPDFTTVRVTPHFVEAVGEETAKYLRMKISQATDAAMLAQHIAGQLALMRARQGLELNPDLGALSQKIMAEGCQAVAALRASQSKLPRALSRA